MINFRHHIQIIKLMMKEYHQQWARTSNLNPLKFQGRLKYLGSRSHLQLEGAWLWFWCSQHIAQKAKLPTTFMFWYSHISEPKSNLDSNTPPLTENLVFKRTVTFGCLRGYFSWSWGFIHLDFTDKQSIQFINNYYTTLDFHLQREVHF